MSFGTKLESRCFGKCCRHFLFHILYWGRVGDSCNHNPILSEWNRKCRSNNHFKFSIGLQCDPKKWFYKHLKYKRFDSHPHWIQTTWIMPQNAITKLFSHVQFFLVSRICDIQTLIQSNVRKLIRFPMPTELHSKVIEFPIECRQFHFDAQKVILEVSRRDHIWTMWLIHTQQLAMTFTKCSDSFEYWYLIRFPLNRAKKSRTKKSFMYFVAFTFSITKSRN